MTKLTPDLVRDLSDYLASWLELQRRRRRTPGIQAAIRAGDEVVLDVALGLSDLDSGEPLTTEHLFRIASHSKTFTATAIFQLLEDGRLRLDDPVQQWVPELAGAEVGPVTLRELLGHQAGVIRDGADSDFWQLIGPFPDREMLLALAREAGVVYAPNEHFKYSNIGYGLLGLVIEAASGQSYAEYVGEHIVDRLGLERTGPELDNSRAAEYAGGHTGLIAGDDERWTIRHVDTRALAAATGFYSTARDLTTYGAAHVLGSEALLEDRSKRLMQRLESVVRRRGKDVGRYGVGIELGEVGERQVVGHSGGYPGHITRTWIDPEDGLVVSVLTNVLEGPATELAEGLIRIIDLALDVPDDLPAVPDGVDLDRFTGRFVNLWGVTDVVRLGDRLVLLHPTAPNPVESVDELEVIDDATLRLRPEPGFGNVGERITYTFSEDDDGVSVSSVRIGGGTAWPEETFTARREAMVRGEGAPA
ncbi:beta-lactamase [Beutenbergia cavernae DSM 12333]|uniref:Beta-lactamase n=1 Tax=Beutenbergia cavernae (strain ATCC BAA-8 / DSM 12333 / CCUG 43141 / JCM 11478 / NBRC 16432 / NCIMB 13614 / HKI 0122) TaxID=471853 RepID=C5BZQ6_BEUC1|nr:serine hydrolase domain-containing protein [Beutenbergia cavernae]ACQ81236.1 beta-lactamase [Beutenbergia cavernae DSM 12333]